MPRGGCLDYMDKTLTDGATSAIVGPPEGRMARVPVDDRRGSFNVKAVVRETGLKPDTLRAWERRYRLPRPERTAGGHRLYSQRDIDCLRWLAARQTEGLSSRPAGGARRG